VAEAQDSQILELSVDEFTALEERVLRAVNLVKRERLTRVEAEQNAAHLEAQLAQQRPVMDQLQTEVHSLRSERDQVRQRVERLLAQLDALEI
jgi:septal ring factor EnvC (AmiA/AmiB activator)